MTVVRFKNRPNGIASFNNLLSDVFPQMPSLYHEDAKRATPVNISETEAAYILELIVPGMSKEDFNIKLEENMLTITGAKKEEGKAENVKTIRNEYNVGSVNRSFTMDKKIDAENISAQYVNGVLILNLPKKADVKPATKQISIL